MKNIVARLKNSEQFLGLVQINSELELLSSCERLIPTFDNVVRLHHESWWRPIVLKTLQEANIAFCGISYPGLPDHVYKSAEFMYYRFHGVPKLYLSSYNRQELKFIVDEIKRKRGVEDVYLYFNNDIEVAAVRNAKTVKGMI